MYENGVQEGAAARPCYFSIVVHSLKFLSSDLWLTRRFSSLGLVDATFLTHITIASVYSQYYILRSQEGYMGDSLPSIQLTPNKCLRRADDQSERMFPKSPQSRHDVHDGSVWRPESA